LRLLRVSGGYHWLWKTHVGRLSVVTHAVCSGAVANSTVVLAPHVDGRSHVGGYTSAVSSLREGSAGGLSLWEGSVGGLNLWEGSVGGLNLWEGCVGDLRLHEGRIGGLRLWNSTACRERLGRGNTSWLSSLCVLGSRPQLSVRSLVEWRVWKSKVGTDPGLRQRVLEAVVLVQVLYFMRRVQVLQADGKAAISEQVGLGKVIIDGILGVGQVGALVEVLAVWSVPTILAVVTVAPILAIAAVLAVTTVLAVAAITAQVVAFEAVAAAVPISVTVASITTVAVSTISKLATVTSVAPVFATIAISSVTAELSIAAMAMPSMPVAAIAIAVMVVLIILAVSFFLALGRLRPFLVVVVIMMVVSMLVIVPVALVRVDIMAVIGTDRGAKNAIQMIVEIVRCFWNKDGVWREDYAGRLVRGELALEF